MGEPGKGPAASPGEVPKKVYEKREERWKPRREDHGEEQWEKYGDYRRSARGQRRGDDFEDRFDRFAGRVEGTLIRLVVLFLVGLALAQILLTKDTGRGLLSLVDRLEGMGAGVVSLNPRAGEGTVPVTGASGKETVTVILVTRSKAPKAVLLVDSIAVGDFRDGKVTFPVAPGQLIEVAAEDYREPLTFRVVAISGIREPGLGTEVTTSGDIQTIGRVR